MSIRRPCATRTCVAMAQPGREYCVVCEKHPDALGRRFCRDCHGRKLCPCCDGLGWLRCHRARCQAEHACASCTRTGFCRRCDGTGREPENQHAALRELGPLFDDVDGTGDAEARSRMRVGEPGQADPSRAEPDCRDREPPDQEPDGAGRPSLAGDEPECTPVAKGMAGKAAKGAEG